MLSQLETDARPESRRVPLSNHEEDR